MENPNRPKAVDLFAGAGGMSLGVEQAGFDVVCAVEYNPIHAATHSYNLPETPVIVRSVVGLSGAEIAEHLDGDRLDLLTGGPPCQGFSTIGQKSLLDPRNSLVVEYMRLVKELRPRTFIMENVKGLTLGKNREFLGEIVAGFEAAGYSVLPWRVLDAADYGVPQHRERLILIGYDEGESAPAYPLPLDVSVNCAQALADLPDVDAFPHLIDRDEVDWDLPAPFGDYAAQLRNLDGQGWWFGAKRPIVRKLTSSMRTDHSWESRSRFAVAPLGRLEEVTRFFKLDPDGKCNTLRAGTDASRGSFTSPRPIHYRDHRCVTVREMARLHGMPDWYRLHVTKAHGARQVGNSVPPPLARAVAGEVLKALGATAQARDEVVPFGDPGLLSMTMQEACRLFGVPDPIGGRRGFCLAGAARILAEMETSTWTI